jgi:hypothetical protein
VTGELAGYFVSLGIETEGFDAAKLALKSVEKELKDLAVAAEVVRLKTEHGIIPPFDIKTDRAKRAFDSIESEIEQTATKLEIVKQKIARGLLPPPPGKWRTFFSTISGYGAKAAGVISKVGKIGLYGAGIAGAGVAASGLLASKLYDPLIGFNERVEDTKMQLAGMFALVKKTNFNDEILGADAFYAKIQKRAEALPGSAADYAAFASQVARSVLQAGLSMGDLEDITVRAVVAGEAFGTSADETARDINQLMAGQFNSDDKFSKILLGTIGFDDDGKGSEKIKKMSKLQRAELLKTALAQKQIDQMSAAKGKSFGGVMSTTKDIIAQTMGRVGEPLFRELKRMSNAFNAWADKNKEKISAWAETIGEKVKNAFVVISGAIESAFTWLFENWPAIVEVFRKIGSAVEKTVNAVGWVGDKVGWVAGKVNTLNPFKSNEKIGDAISALIEQQKPVTENGFLADVIRTYGTPSAQSAVSKNTTQSITIQNTINANGLTKDQASALIDEKNASTWRQVSETIAGSRGE